MEMTNKVKLMCSYGGKIQPRPNTNHLMYLGGDTKILTVDRHVRFSELLTRLNSLCNNNNSGGASVVSGDEHRIIKYQLPGEDLDALVSLVDDDDVEHMMFEYDRILNNPNKAAGAAARIRLFLFTPNKQSPVSPGSNNPPLNPDFLFGFDKDYVPSDPSNKVISVGDSHRILPALDLLQIPGVIVPGFSGSDHNDTGNVNNPFSYMVQVLSSGRDINHNNNNNNGTSGPQVNVAANVCRIPVVAAGGAHGGGGGYSAVPGMVNWTEQLPVYNYVAAMPCVPEQKMMVATMVEQLRQEVKVNQKNV